MSSAPSWPARPRWTERIPELLRDADFVMVDRLTHAARYGERIERRRFGYRQADKIAAMVILAMYYEFGTSLLTRTFPVNRSDARHVIEYVACVAHPTALQGRREISATHQRAEA